MRDIDRLFIFKGSDLYLPAAGRQTDVAPDVFAAEDPGPLSPGGGGWPGLDALESLPVILRRDFPASGLACAAVRLGASSNNAEPSFAGLVPVSFRAALAELPPMEAGRAAKGLSLLNWHDISQKCGACGAALADDPKEGYENGARRCPSCSRVYYPRVSPAVIVLVRKAGKILLAHNSAFPDGRFGLIAGFVEPGESIEETVRRELREEARIEVGDLRYVASQPWPFPDSLMLAFEAEWAAGEGQPDGVEITELRWCGPDELPSIPPPGSVARRLIDRWLAG